MALVTSLARLAVNTPSAAVARETSAVMLACSEVSAAALNNASSSIELSTYATFAKLGSLVK